MNEFSDSEAFARALELHPEGEQNQWVREHCDPKQRDQVLRLLEAHRQLDGSTHENISSLDSAEAFFRAFGSAEPPMVGSTVGIYQLVEKIGEGGVGIVFRASPSERLDRDVAIKLLKPGMDSQRVLARFALERQVLEKLDHPGITPILDSGFQPNGRPYYVMQLVRDALTITDYSAKHRIDSRQKIELIVSICDVVQHAHRHGVIHRDLKPSNILFEGTDDAVAQPRLIDFGIAKITHPNDDRSQAITQTGERFGTPAYMSPEQTRSDGVPADIRSDVYSLGVILFELLTGSTPYELATSGSKPESGVGWTERTIERHTTAFHPEEIAATVRSSKVPPELDRILLKALASDPVRRYQTVSDFQRDLQRFLAGEPVEAVGPSLSYRFSKLVRRHRTLAIATSLLLVTIVSTAVVTTYFSIRALRAERRAKDQLAEALLMQEQLSGERNAAEEARQRAESTVRAFLVQRAVETAGRDHSLQLVQRLQTRGSKRSPKKLERLEKGYDVMALVEPHERLIVRGDWRWTAQCYSSDFDLVVRLTSAQARDLPAIRNTLPPDPQANEEARNTSPDFYGSFQEKLLIELRKLTGENDTFLAEVLDNCGLVALENLDFDLAEKQISEAGRIWSFDNQFPANAAQSNLFLAEVHLAQANSGAASEAINNASKFLAMIPPGDSHRKPLKSLHKKLAQELKVQSGSR